MFMLKIINSFKKYLIMGIIAIISVIGIYKINQNINRGKEVKAASKISFEQFLNMQMKINFYYDKDYKYLADDCHIVMNDMWDGKSLTVSEFNTQNISNDLQKKLKLQYGSWPTTNNNGRSQYAIYYGDLNALDVTVTTTTQAYLQAAKTTTQTVPYSRWRYRYLDDNTGIFGVTHTYADTMARCLYERISDLNANSTLEVKLVLTYTEKSYSRYTEYHFVDDASFGSLQNAKYYQGTSGNLYFCRSKDMMSTVRYLYLVKGSYSENDQILWTPLRMVNSRIVGRQLTVNVSNSNIVAKNTNYVISINGYIREFNKDFTIDMVKTSNPVYNGYFEYGDQEYRNRYTNSGNLYYTFDQNHDGNDLSSLGKIYNTKTGANIGQSLGFSSIKYDNDGNMYKLRIFTDKDVVNEFKLTVNDSRIKAYANGVNVANSNVVVGTSLSWSIDGIPASAYTITSMPTTMPSNDVTVTMTLKTFKATIANESNLVLNGTKSFTYNYDTKINLPTGYTRGAKISSFIVDGNNVNPGSQFNAHLIKDLTITPVLEYVNYKFNNIDNDAFSLTFDKNTTQVNDIITATFVQKDKGYTVDSTNLLSDAIEGGKVSIASGEFTFVPKLGYLDENVIFDLENHINSYNVYYSNGTKNSKKVDSVVYKSSGVLNNDYFFVRDLAIDGYYVSNYKAYIYDATNNTLGDEIEIINNKYIMPSDDIIFVGEIVKYNYDVILSLDKTVNYVDDNNKLLLSSPLYKEAYAKLNLSIDNADETYKINTTVEDSVELPVVRSPYRIFKGWYISSNKNQFENEGFTSLKYYKTAQEAIEDNPNSTTLNLYPYFEVVKATVNFMVDGIVYDSVKAYVNTTIESANQPSDPTNSALGVFGGWYSDVKYENEYVFGETLLAEKQTIALYSRWLNEEYLVSFYNYNGDLIYSYSARTNSNPSYDAQTYGTPFKEMDRTATYTFAGWDKAFSPVKSDISYTAQYSPSYINYIVEYKNADGTVLSKATYHFADRLVAPANPTLDSTAQYEYEFTGWDNKTDLCEGHMTITALYKEILRNYTITWNVNGNEIDMQFNYGDTPVFTGNLEKNGTKRTNFEFAGWTPEITLVVGNQIYTALYDEVDKVFEVTFYDVYDEEIVKISYKYGEKIEMPENYATFSLKEGVRFNGWVNENNESIDNLLSVSETLRAYPSFVDENNELIDNDPLNLSKEENVKVVVEELENINDVDLSSISDNNSSLRYYRVSRYVGDRRIANDTEGAQVTFGIDNQNAGTYQAYLVKEDGSLEAVDFENLSADGLVLNMEHLGKVIVRYDSIPTINLADGIRALAISSVVLAALCAVVFLKTKNKNAKIIQLEKRD